eukprot:m51a1_g14081 hypothetical protein (300) ;mRNA; f:230-1649
MAEKAAEAETGRGAPRGSDRVAVTVIAEPHSSGDEPEEFSLKILRDTSIYKLKSILSSMGIFGEAEVFQFILVGLEDETKLLSPEKMMMQSTASSFTFRARLIRKRVFFCDTSAVLGYLQNRVVFPYEPSDETVLYITSSPLSETENLLPRKFPGTSLHEAINGTWCVYNVPFFPVTRKNELFREMYTRCYAGKLNQHVTEPWPETVDEWEGKNHWEYMRDLNDVYGLLEAAVAGFYFSTQPTFGGARTYQFLTADICFERHVLEQWRTVAEVIGLQVPSSFVTELFGIYPLRQLPSAR